jgi:PIN domain nuclease of toxin-antitoxin system
MSALLVDTHVVVWHLFAPHRLSAAARTALLGKVTAGEPIHVSAVSIVEVTYLVEKGKLPPATLTGLIAALNDPALGYALLPLDGTIAQAVQQIPRAVVPDFPDRIIGATALVHGLPLVTADRKLQAAAIPTIW